MSDKNYDYRPTDDDNWEVFSILNEDDEDSGDWVATVSTETVAENLVLMLEHSVEYPTLKLSIEARPAHDVAAPSETNEKVYAALLHVNNHHSEVTQVFYSTDGRWLYCDDDYAAPTFGNDIDISLLEDAVDSLAMLPAAFSLSNSPRH